MHHNHSSTHPLPPLHQEGTTSPEASWTLRYSVVGKFSTTPDPSSLTPEPSPSPPWEAPSSIPVGVIWKSALAWHMWQWNWACPPNSPLPSSWPPLFLAIPPANSCTRKSFPVVPPLSGVQCQNRYPGSSSSCKGLLPYSLPPLLPWSQWSPSVWKSRPLLVPSTQPSPYHLDMPPSRNRETSWYKRWHW